MEQISENATGSALHKVGETSARRPRQLSLALFLLVVGSAMLVLFSVRQMILSPVMVYSPQESTPAREPRELASAWGARPATTPTPISTPDPVRVRVGTVGAPAGAISATVLLDLVVLTDRVNVGLLSAAVAYDAALLTATGCAQGAAMDLLLCNVETPGVVQLAGVSALGIRSETTVAELTFELVQTADRNVPLSVTIKRLGDGNGIAVGATAVDGALDLNCAPDAETCERGINIYLPLIRR